jgi:hypothetical protein
MAKQTRGTSTKAINDWELEISKLVRKQQELNNEGKSAEQIQKKLGGSFEELRKRGDRLTKQTERYAAATKDADKANRNLKTRLDKINAGTAKLISNEKKLTVAIKKNTDAKKKNAAAGGKVIKSNANISKGTKGATGSFGKFAKGVGSAMGTLARFATAGAILAVAMKAIKFVVVDSVKAFVQFQDAVKNLSAVAGVTGKDLDALSQNALEVAGQTRFTAIEVVKLQTELSKLGFSAKEVVAATSSISFAAQALGADVGTTAEQVGKLINQFNLLAEDSDEIADILVTTINNSALSLDSFSTAVQYIGPIANDLGISLEQTAGAMAILADNGFTASRVGTGLRAIFTKLGTETVDVEGKLRQLAEQNLSVADAAELVGVRNASQLITLLANIDALDENNNRYYEMGRAMKAAATQSTSVSGQIAILKSEINKMQVSIGEAIISSDLFTQAIGILSYEAKKTIQAFKALEGISTNDLQEDMERLASGVDAQTVALERLAKQSGKTAEQYQRDAQKEVEATFNVVKWLDKFQKTQTGINRLAVSSAKWIAIKIGLTQDEVLAVQGLTDAYEEQYEQIRKNILIEQQRGFVDDEYEERLQALITKELKGFNVQKEAAEAANEIQTERIKLRESIEATQDIIDNGTLDAIQLQAYEDAILQMKAREKQLQGFQRRFSNFIKDIVKGTRTVSEPRIERKVARDFKDQVDIAEDAKKAIDKRNEALNAAAEANKNYTETVFNDIDANKKKQAENVKFIQYAYSEIEVLGRKIAKEKENVDSKGQLTKQAAHNISVMEREQKTLHNLIRTYDNKNDALETNVSNILAVTQAAKNQIAALKNQYDKGEITGVEMKRGESAIYEQMKTDLMAVAGDDPDLQMVAQAIIDNIQPEYGVDWNKVLYKGIDEAISTVVGALEGFNDTAFENTKNRLEAEKEAIKARYETEDYLAKQQFENGLINEAQYRRRQAALRKKQIAEENAIEKKLFEAEQKKDRNDAKVEFLEAVASIIPTLIKEGIAEPTTLNIMAAITAASAAASYAAEVSAINQRKFYPKKFAEGGMVHGPSHQDGGVPFSVQGQGGYEMEGGEFIVNKRAASLHRDLLERLNQSVTPVTSPVPMKYAQGGVVTNSVTNVSQQSQESVNYLKAIAEATTTNAINSSRPVRAFVTSTDLRKDENARRIKDNNTTI